MNLQIPPALADRYHLMSDRTGRTPEALMIESLTKFLLVLDWQQRRLEDGADERD